jgi:riboflavin synthase
MFTGLVEHMGTIVGIGKKGNSFHLTIDSLFDLGKSDIGASIAVDGVCLTVVKIEGKRFTVEVSPETLSRTTLGERKGGEGVNLERALRLSDRLGGHLVSGHIDGPGVVKEIKEEENAIIFVFSTSPDIARYLVGKGSVAINGISLTVNDVQNTDFSVSVIPHTARVTTIGKRRIGDRVNIETDIIGKYVEKFFQTSSQAPEKEKEKSVLDEDFLKRHGFS